MTGSLSLQLCVICTDNEALQVMLEELCTLIRAGKLSAPSCTEVGIKDFRKAVNDAMKPYITSKQILVMWSHIMAINK